jgi:hypothetical protein
MSESDGDYVLNPGESLDDLLDDLRTNQPRCVLCGKAYTTDGESFSFAQKVHWSCKEKAGYKSWEAIPQITQE